MIKVVRIIARLNVGGPARHVVWLAQDLPTAEFSTLLVTGVVPPGEDDMSYFAVQHNVTPYVLKSMSRELSPKDLFTVFAMFRLLLRERPDIVHTHTAKAGTIGRVAGLFYKWLSPGTLIGRPRQCRFVHTYHGHIFHSYYGKFKSRLFLTIERVLARLVTDRIVVLSESQRTEIHDQFKVGSARQFAVIPLGLDLERYRDWASRRALFRAQELQVDEHTIVVGIVGRLTEVKNHMLFLNALARCIESRGSKLPKCRFVIIGDGHLGAQLRAEADRLKLNQHLTFLGHRSDPENFYPALDVVALTSLNEGTPLTLIEAMANARPIVATAVGGVVDLLGHPLALAADDSRISVRERGIVVPSEDASAFAGALALLIDDAALRSRLAAQSELFVRDNYAKERLLYSVANLYRTLVKNDTTSALG